MKLTKRIRKYMQTMTDVMHTTLNPEGPGVVRIHLVPPKQQEDMGNVSVAIINGQDIIPVNLSWAILLTEFIKEVNHYHGRAITEEDSKAISRAVIRNMRKIYPLLPGRIIRRAASGFRRSRWI